MTRTTKPRSKRRKRKQRANRLKPSERQVAALKPNTMNAIFDLLAPTRGFSAEELAWQIARVYKQRPTTRGVRNVLSRLRRSGYVEETPLGRYRLTAGQPMAQQ